MFAAGLSLCGRGVPQNPKTYFASVEKVLGELVHSTPGKDTFIDKAKSGKVSGAAACYTEKPATCKSCLQHTKARLERCKGSTSGGNFNEVCNMEFWRTGDN
ncbi:unnamed protein product [Linum tenue]|uniref:Gnk2-homologous domain-containing protein n=1 Tax=Linum tenue TaxID=586396 RepID=A0AAV0S3J7_9ROSI|nr:unnamed protein product [Linum tenue]